MSWIFQRTLALLVLLASLAGFASAGSETPPAGPPWQREFRAAQELALKQGLPIFVYLTKTH